MKKYLISLSCLFLTINAYAFSPQEIYSKSVTAILSLESETSSGTGFFVGSQGVVLTNAHVIRGATQKTFKGTSYNGNKYSNFELLYSDPVADIAILKVIMIQERDTFLEMAEPQEKLMVGDDSYWIGHPCALNEFTFSKGYIGKINIQGLPRDLQLHGVGFHGSSGSPFLNKEGKVIGMLAAGNSKKETISLAPIIKDGKSEKIGNWYKFRQKEEYEGVSFGLSKYTILEAMSKVKNINQSEPTTEVQLANHDANSNNSSEKKVDTSSGEDDFALLMRKLRAYTPAGETKLGSL